MPTLCPQGLHPVEAEQTAGEGHRGLRDSQRLVQFLGRKPQAPAWKVSSPLGSLGPTFVAMGPEQKGS